jgi:glycosyltransferase involved in cell wall biosynthesis/acyl carrier protein
MIITGNSNVDCFNRLGFEIDVEGEKVIAYWVGALQIEHFYQSIPIGEKVRSIFAAEKGWKFLSIGPHDIFQLWGAASQGRLTAVSRLMMQRYEAIFRELNGSGKFGWLVFPQPLHEVNFQNVTEKDKLDITRGFNRQIAKLCACNGILVINPLKTILGKDGLPSCGYLQEDGLHMNDSGAGLYIEEITKLTGTSIGFQPKKMLFEPRSEPESFCSLLLNNAHMEAERGLEVEGLSLALAGFLSERLKQKGLDIDVDGETELVDSGILDSLDLVETYTFAASAMRMDIPFDVSLRDLNTVHKISEYLTEKKGGSVAEKDSQPVKSDFLLSLRGDFDDPAQRAEILEAEILISKLDDPSFASFQENIAVACAGGNCNYGIVPFWIALNQARRGDYRGALVLLDYASSPRLRFPFSDPRVQFYRSKWEAKKAPRIWENQIDESIISSAGPGHAEVSRKVSGALPGTSISYREEARRRPLVSVITPSFNQARYIEQNIRSVLGQQYPEIEHIVIDGGSMDGTVEVLKRFPHLKWISEKDNGQSDALNKGFAMASGDIVCWLNSDDWLAPEAFHRVAQEFASGQKSVLMGKCLLTDPSGKPFKEQANPERSFYHLMKYWIPYSIPAQPAIFFARSLLESVRRCDGTYVDPSLHFAMDHDLWARMMKSARFHSIDRVLSYYRYHDESKTVANGNVFVNDWSVVFKRYALKDTRTIGIFGDSRGAGELNEFVSNLRAALPYFLVDLGTAWVQEALSKEGSPEWIVWPGEPPGAVAPEAYAEAVKLLAQIESIGCVKITPWLHDEKDGSVNHARPKSPSFVFRRFALEELAAEGQLGRQSGEIAAALTQRGWKAMELRYPAQVSLSGHIECNPLISVVITCYNYGRHLRECVESILSQSLQSYEIIIVNDGSTDDSQSIAESLIDESSSKAMRIIRQPNSGKPAVARNNGISQAIGKYILCLDADDKLSPDFLLQCARTLEFTPGVSIAYPDQQNFGEVTTFEPHPEYDFTTLTKFNYICSSVAMFPKRVWEIVGGFSTDVGYEDWDFWISCGERGFHGKRVPGAILWYRKHSQGQYSKDRAADQKIKAQIVLNHAALYRPAQIRWAVGVLREDPSAVAIDGGLGVIPAIQEPKLVPATHPAAMEPAGGNGPRPILHALATKVPRHILFFMYGWHEEGGGTILPRQIARALAAQGYELSVIFTGSRILPEKRAYHVEEGNENGIRLFGVYNRPAIFYDLENPQREIDDPNMRSIVSRLIAHLQPDIVHYHSLLNFSMGVPEVVSRAGRPSVYTSHNYWPLCPRMYLFQKDLKLCSGPSDDGSKCAACIGRPDKAADYALRVEHGRRMFDRHIGLHLAVSNRVRQLFIENGHSPSRICVLQQQPETVDHIWQYVGACRVPENSSKRPLRVGFIGSLLPQKGIHVLVAAGEVFEAGQIEIHVFGSGPAAYVEALEKIDRKNLVRFHGHYELSQLPELLGCVDLVVIPSVWEDCAPLVVAEALAARIPVIGSRIGGIPDFIQEGVNGFLFEPGNPAALAGTLRRLVENPSLLPQIQQNIFPGKGFNGYLAELLDHYGEVVSSAGNNSVSAKNSASPEKRLNVIWEGSQFVYHSLALINRELCLKLIDAGHNVAVIPYEKDQFGPEAAPRFHKIASCVNKRLPCMPNVHVRHQWPPNFVPPPSGHWVMIQPWEFGRLPEDWIGPMSDLVDEIWVPSKYVLKSYVVSGIPVERVRVVPNGVNTDIFHPGAAPYPLPTRKKFKFLFVGGTIWRKGIDLLIEAYRSTFRRQDDVVLIVKDIGVDSFYKGQGIGDTIRQIQDDPAAPELVYLTEVIEERDIPGLFTACNCLVHPYRGEGFGLPVLEAMACGIPVIVTSGGATDDFCLQEFSYQISAGRREVNVDGMRLAGGAGYVLEPDLQSIRDMLRTVYENPAIAKQKAQSALEHVRKRYTWDNVAGLVQDRIRSLAREPIRRLNAQKLASDIRITPPKQEGLSLST